MISPAAVRSSSPTITRQAKRSRSSTRAGDGVVIGDAHHIEPAGGDSGSELIGRGRGIAAPHRVRVQVDTNVPVTLWVCEMGMLDQRLG